MLFLLSIIALRYDMDLQASMDGMASRLQEAGKTIADLCREAEIARSTWDRWAAGHTAPNTRTWLQVQAAFDRIVREAA